MSDFLYDDLDQLYQQVILDHSRHPRNFHEIGGADAKAEGYNPLCGDRVTLYMKLNGKVIEDVAFTGSGCAICTASASMMTQALKGKTLDELEAMFERYHVMLTEECEEGEAFDDLGKLAVFSGVKKYPVRVKCATLPWHTLMAAIKNEGEPVTTE